ncbi:hypothetical protein [Amycolatopsis australiensis]|uniref:hypothetical protein n=1 Tax=Amycolatopsis australiensis TaxID=546364 RepID=UPI00093060F2|nr:hypothetical protein [Amycolatopsis australiensis]
MDLDAPYRVNPHEPFEALAHRCACLSGAPDVVRFVRDLAMHATARDALDAADLGETSRARVVAALERLAAAGIIVAEP